MSIDNYIKIKIQIKISGERSKVLKVDLVMYKTMETALVCIFTGEHRSMGGYRRYKKVQEHTYITIHREIYG